MHDEADFEFRLWNYAQGEPDVDIEGHVLTCGNCQDELAALRRLAQLRDTAGGALAAPPSSVLIQASGLLARIRPDLVAQPRALSDKMRERLRQVAASLLIDTGLTLPVAGLRAEADRRTRQLVFTSDVADLDLEVSRLDEGFSVAGQLGMDVVPKNLTIRFVPADQDALAEDIAGAHEAGISGQGYFTLAIDAGDWTAAVEIDDAVVVFPGVHL